MDGSVESRLCSVPGVILVAALPFVSISGFAYLYTALPLHVFDQGWPLWHLSVMLSVCFIFRLIASAIVSRVGMWAMLLNCAVCVGLSTWMVIVPESLSAVYVGVFSSCTSISTTTYRSLVYLAFESGGNANDSSQHGGDDRASWQLQRALRWFTLFDTIGYSCGPFIGGAFYDAGGFSLCSRWQLATQVTCLVLPLLLPEVRASIWLSVFGCPAGKRAMRHVAAIDDFPAANAVKPEAALEREANSDVVDNMANAAPISKQAVLAATAPPLAWLPISVILVATFTNIAVYGVEWCLYAIYFRSVFGWSGAAIGAAQMAGDLLGGLVLAGSTLDCTTRAVSGLRRSVPSALSTLLRPPLAVAVLLASHGVLMVLLAQPLFGVALMGQVCPLRKGVSTSLLLRSYLPTPIAGHVPPSHHPPDPVFARRLASQILMGTVYVFCEQFVQEMLVIYSVGSHNQYKRLVFYHYIFFCGGACACAPIAIGLFELLSFERTFYVSAVWAGVAGCLFAAFFMLRLAGTSEGIFGTSLADAEIELRCRRSMPSSVPHPSLG